MKTKYLFGFFVMIFCITATVNANSVPPAEQVCGKWESSEKKLIIQVYVENGQFRAKLTWYANTGGKPLDYWKDVNNPDPKLRSRTLLGMGILSNLKYDKDKNSWEDGIVYDSRHGHYWNASAYIDKHGLLQVRGYWHFKFIGRTMTFYRVI